MHIPYLNVPCLVNQTCFYGQCQHVEDVLIGWYEFCLCEPSYVGFECNTWNKFSRTDWMILLSILLCFLATILCLLSIPFFYYILKDEYYPQVIECARSSPYVEVEPIFSFVPTTAVLRLYRIPSEYLSRRRTILDGLVPIHSISSLAYSTGIRHMTEPRQATI